MKYTREMLSAKIEKNDTNFFYENVYETTHYGKDDEVRVVYDQHWGDGNDYFITMEFPKLGLFVLLSGSYSSWDSSSWDTVEFAEPYEYTETRYKGVTLQYMRDKTITEVLKDEDEAN